MLAAWRIVREKHVGTAFSGEGAAEYGGRWNLPGVRVAYASSSQSLAALELLVHLNPPQPFQYKVIRAEFNESLVESILPATLPADWTAEPPLHSTQRLGSRWATQSRSAVLAVPSAIIPQEVNYLFNPLHPDFMKVRLGYPMDFAFDRRLIE